jgi:uncharacterized tellurite resistance protein B-like protein
VTASATVSEWARIDQRVTVAGAPLSGVYVGTATSHEVVDPDLPVDLTAPDWHASTVTRPPHYGELTPAARAAFLVWHRTSRRASQAPAVWALLHLYGLERRVLVEDDRDPALRREAAELGEVYGADPDVARVVAVLTGYDGPTSPPPLAAAPVPDSLQVELGRRALASEAVTADWALAWAWYHPDLTRRDAARRAPDEFAALWRHHFAERFPDGFTAKPRRRRLTVEYVPANPALPTPLEITVGDASDVFLTPTPARAFAKISDQVESEMASYVRWVTSHPADADTVYAAAVLPGPLLVGTPIEAASRPMVEFVETALEEAGTALVDGAPLVDGWLEATKGSTVERRDAVAIAQVLDRHELGIEPDVRFGGRPLDRRSPVAVFRYAGPPATSPSEAYAAALVALELSAAVASADGKVDETEQSMLIEQVHRAKGLTEAERARLDAHRVLVTSSDLRLKDVASRMVGLSVVERHSLGSHLLDVARADGAVTEDEVRVLRAIHELLDLNPAEVDRRLRIAELDLAPSPPQVDQLPADDEHRDEELASPAPDTAEPHGEAESLEELSAPAAASSTLIEALPATPPSPVGPSDEGDESEPAAVGGRLVQVDEDRLRVRQADNQRVQSLLTAIFADQEPAELDDEAPAPVTPESEIAHLDAAHFALLSDLLSRGTTARPDLERVAGRWGVLPDGALDVINEAALDLTEEPVIEVHDDESVTVDSAIYEEMRA